MDYIYHLANTSLTLRVAHYLRAHPEFPTEFMTVIHQIDGWVVRVKVKDSLDSSQAGDFLAFMNELGIPYQPDIRIRMALWSLESGQSPTQVMRRYHVAIVSHGEPNFDEIQLFQHQFVKGLGYCPETLA